MRRRFDSMVKASMLRALAVKTLGLVLLAGVALAWAPPMMEAESPAYREGREALDRRDWRAAEQAFQRAAGVEGEEDAATYWLAYSQAKGGRAAAALATLDELAKRWPRSRWRDDAETLRLEMQASGGRSAAREDADEELKLMALVALGQADPERALPLVEKILRGDGSRELKERALFVAGQSGGQKGAELLLSLARDGSDPELQEEAIQYLAIGGKKNLPALAELYESGASRPAKEAILHAFMIAGARERLLQAAREEPDDELRATAAQLLGTQGAVDELWQLYQQESSRRIREGILQGFMISGEHEHLRKVAFDAGTDPELRSTAIQLLGIQGDGEGLLQAFKAGGSEEIKLEIVQAMAMAGSDAQVAQVIEDASQPLEVRRKATVSLGVHGDAEALWRIYQNGHPELRDELLQGLALGGKERHLLEIAKDAKQPTEARVAATQALVVSGAPEAEMTGLYRSAEGRELKEAVLNVLMVQGGDEALVEIVRTEKDPELRAKAVQMLGLTGSPRAADVLEEILSE